MYIDGLFPIIWISQIAMAHDHPEDIMIHRQGQQDKGICLEVNLSIAPTFSWSLQSSFWKVG